MAVEGEATSSMVTVARVIQGGIAREGGGGAGAGGHAPPAIGKCLGEWGFCIF